MLISLSLPVLVLAGGLTGIPGLNWLKGFKLRRPPPPPADTIPPAWKSPSRLALEHQFMRASLPPLVSGTAALKVKTDPRKLRIGLDPDSGMVSAVPELGEFRLGQTTLLPLSEYSGEMTRRNFQRQMSERNAEYLRDLAQRQSTTGSSGTATGLSFKLPSPLPRQMQSLLGPGGPALNISGSENIRLSGQSNWTNQQLGPQGRKPSLFPSLDMQQDLDIRLEGQLSDRVKVNLLQNSGIQIPLANRIAINYKGDEDDLVQALDLGNTNLSLPGTQYVSYSGKNEGLFGVKSSLRIGALDFSILASKQEGRSERASYRGGASSQRGSIADMDYVKGVYYFLYDPNLGDVLDIQNTDIHLFLDDYDYSNDQTSVPGRAFVDTGLTCENYGNPQTCDTTSVRGTFTRLYPGPENDYEILEMYGPSFKVIRLRRQISGDQRLAVAYRARRLFQSGPGPAFEVGQAAQADSIAGGLTPTGLHLEADGTSRLYLKLLRAPSSVVRPDPTTLFFTRDSVFALSRDLELKNFYQLPGQQIDRQSFTLTIRQGVDDPPVTSIVRTDGTSVPYLEVLGLDSFDQSSGGQIPGPDGKVDGTFLSQSSQQMFVDFENGILFFPDLRPFAPRIGTAYQDQGGAPQFRFDQFVSDSLVIRRETLTGPPETNNAANVAIYDKYILLRSQDTRYWLDLDFTAARAVGEISLGRGNLLEGSDVVSINGVTLVRDRDYTIDYDLGRITMKKQVGPADQLNIDYSYAPLFQQAGRTLIGNAFRLEGRDKSFGGAFMYESKGAQDQRPRLGEEPSRTFIGDLNTAFTARPMWLTRLVDRLPGVRTTAPSEFSLQAEVGASFPNPNTKNVVYIDDMEGVKDGVGVSMTGERWSWSSVPPRKRSTGDEPILDDPLQRNAEVHWYTPLAAVKEGDLKPNLTNAEGAQNSHPSLAISIPRRPAAATSADTLWAGLTYPLDTYGLDLSRAQFIEVWVNDFNAPSIRDTLIGVSRAMKLHIDLGKVSEDQMRAPDVPPNDTLDTEDRWEQGSAPDRQLDVTGTSEDTGVDQRNNEQERAAGIPRRDLTTATPEDPEGDDFRPVEEGAPEDMDPARFRGVNGTEENHTLNPTPDTEDLNLDNNLDEREEFFRYTIELCQNCSPYLITDVQRDFGNRPVPNPPRADNGWRRYRIPIADTLRTQFGIPDPTLTRHVRVWVEGVMEPDPEGLKRPLLMLGGLDIVGSRWLSTPLTDLQETAGTKLTLSTLNSVDDRGEYYAPFDPGAERTGGEAITRREQSLSLEFENLAPDDTLEVFKTFSLDEDYSRYGNVDWYVSGLKISDYMPGATPLAYFVRFASDEQGRNYYEYRAPVSSGGSVINWDEIKLKLTDLSNLKLASDFPARDPIKYQVPGPRGNDVLTVMGRPSFTRLRRVSFGVINQSAAPESLIRAGTLLLNELRATDIAKDAGLAQRLQMNGRLANLMSYSFAWNGRDANFQSVGESRGSGNTLNQISAGTTLDLHRFFEGTGIVLPISVNYARSSTRPRFTAGDDVIRTGPLETASETRNETRSLSTSYSRQWSDRSNKLLRYTLGGITANYSRNESDGKNPNSVTSSVGQSAAVNYGVSLRNLMVLGLPLTKARLYLLPERAYWNTSISSTQQEIYDRVRGTDSLVLRNAVSGRSGFINFGADTRPFDFFHHHFEGVRNLNLPPEQREKLGPLNIGKVVSWRQNMDARFALNRGPFMSPTFGWNSTYSQNNTPEMSRDLSVRALTNSQGMTASWALPFDRLMPLPVRAAPGDTNRARRPRAPMWKGLLSRLGAIAAEGGYNQMSSYSRLLGTTHFLYLVGISDNPGLSPDGTGRMEASAGNLVTKAQDWRASARTRFSLPVDASVSFRAEHTWRRNEQNRVATRTVSSRFPELEVDYGRLPTTLQLGRIINAPRLRTNYSRSRVTEFRIRESTPTSIATSSQWQPLLGVSGELKNQTRVEFKVERRVTVREALDFGSSVRTDRNTDVNLSLNRSYSRGQKVRILGRESTIKSSVQLGLTAAYSRVSGETKKLGSNAVQLPTDNDRLSVNGTGSYSFSNNVTGSVSLGFGQNRDVVRAVVSRNVRVELRAAFTF